jgi:outer membrane protein OmpA-like peptidoglycan-associated protein
VSWGSAVLDLSSLNLTGMAARLGSLNGTSALAGRNSEQLNGYSTTRIALDTTAASAADQQKFTVFYGQDSFDRGTVWMGRDGCVVKLDLDEAVAVNGSIEKRHYELSRTLGTRGRDSSEMRIPAQVPSAAASSAAAQVPAVRTATADSTQQPAGASSRPATAPYGWAVVNGKPIPPDPSRFLPVPVPSTTPIVPSAATGDTTHDWELKYERTVNGPEADLVVRTGDINNLGFGWPKGFDPFSGNSTPSHPWPWDPRPDAPDGTDRIMIGSSLVPPDDYPQHRLNLHDGYSGALHRCEGLSHPPGQMCKERAQTMPQAIRLAVGALPPVIQRVLVQMFLDDFQAVEFGSHFQVSLNGVRIPSFESAINSLDQTGPIGKLVTLELLPEYWPLLKSGEARLLIDDPTTAQGDGYAVDFVRILVNPHASKYLVSLTASVVDADRHTPIPDAVVSAAPESATTDRSGKCELKGLPAGLVIATASAPGYDAASVHVDLPAGQAGNVEIALRRHLEDAATLESAIERTGAATIYGIHFDTDSAGIRADSLPSLNVVLQLINNRPGSRWVISGHTDNKGSAVRNQPLSESRAAAVVTWLAAHGVDRNRLQSQGFGASRPVADNSTAVGRALNRRVEVALAQ